ncbi:hypothetical protein HC028_15690 [Planosporangium flavigriseum]|uniref:PPE family protein n=1 Tax=Planosporangium flavigriseum TaxID=373681 RepID=A0A8J3LM11_9ACTN|nr:hypothetical protein [Planosporangium flavigriseum]NJC65933.1 hypothetical protein [Planosporangium flavigriseum]GIG75638.1 hypothetical protein Pfl04_40420 [Planosporangium flavigriseum]
MTTSNDGQYGGWCTNWAAYDVPTLWKMLQNEDPLKTSEHIAAWRMTYELLTTHMAELQRCRDELAAKWSAASSPAAAAFLNYVDNMLASMKATGDAAVSTYDGLSGINGALIRAKAEIGKLHEQWQKYQHEEDTSLSIFGWQPFADTPDNWKEQLKVQAARQMSEADVAVFQSSAKLTPPEVYDPGVQKTDSTEFQPDSSTSSGGTSAYSGGSWAQTPFIPAPVAVPPPAPSAPVAPTPTPPGSVLTGGVAAPTAPAPGATPPPITPTPPLSGPALPPTGLISPRPGLLPGEAPISRASTGSAPRQGAPGRGAIGVGGEPTGLHGRAALAPGGVIGGEPAASHPAATPMRRVNPVGGVIGEHPAGAVATSGRQPAGVAGQRGASRRHDESDQHFDPDNPWATEEGVPGVLTPQAAPTSHEAGPGVIGIDR